MKLTQTAPIVLLSLFLLNCKPKASDVADETCKCLESIISQENFTKEDYKKVKDSCVALQREKYGKYIDEDRTFRKDLKTQDFKVEESFKKIDEAYKNQVHKVPAFELINNYAENRFEYSAEWEGLVVETDAWIFKKNSEAQLQLVVYKKIDDKYEVMDIEDHKAQGWKPLNVIGYVLVNLKEGQNISKIKEINDHDYKQQIKIRGRIKSFEYEPFTFFGYKVDKYYFILKDAEIINIADIK